MLQSKEGFARKLIKGRIAEVVFEQMLREAGVFTVLPFGYEYVVPSVAHMHKNGRPEDAVEILRTSPDFVVINRDTGFVHLIEVKYRTHMGASDMKKSAQRMVDSWNPSYLFVATPEGFYFDEAADIVKNNGKVSQLKHKNIPAMLQEKYTKILNDFEGNA